jgi:DNA-binding HxlR family transcriptional regulator
MSKYTIKNWTDKDCDVVGQLFEKLQGRYTLLLVSILALEGRRSFGSLKRSITGISTKTLAERLAHLVKNGIVGNEKIKEGNIEKSYYYIKTGQPEFLRLLKEFRKYSKSVARN